MTTSKKPTCPDCGPAPVNHFMQYTSVLVDYFFSPYSRALNFFVEPLMLLLNTEAMAPPFFKLCSLLGLAKISQAPQDRDSYRTRCLWEEAQRRGIKMYEVRFFNTTTDLFGATFEGKTRVFDGLPRPKGLASKSLDWMDNKAIMQERFYAQGIPVARGSVCSSEKSALEAFHAIGGVSITKPNLGSRSRHTTTHITTDAQLLDGFRKAKKLSPWVVVQEELQGMVYRATLIDGKLVGVMRREPPTVVGDGLHTLKELAEAENKNPKREGPIFHHIPLDKEADEEVARQQLTWESTPEAGRVVTLNQKVGRGSGGITRDVTDITHPDNKELFEKIGRVLADPLVGIDFIIGAIEKSWKDQKACGVIECNSLPFIDLHHYPYAGQVRNAAGALWNLIFPSSNPEGRS